MILLYKLHLWQLLLLVSKSISVLITDSGSNITDGLDYDSEVQNVTFASGQLYAIANINIINDTEIESDEVFDILIVDSTLPAGVIIGNSSQATVTIVDNDGEFFISVFKVIVAILQTECNQLSKKNFLRFIV